VEAVINGGRGQGETTENYARVVKVLGKVGGIFMEGCEGRGGV
jgi:hypothetical protein